MNVEYLVYDENARSDREGLQVNCPNCQYMNFLTNIVGDHGCVRCDFQMDVAITYNGEPDGTPYWEIESSSDEDST